MSHSDGSFELPSEQPQRLSALYQYHNAPEVAPAHGIEYDDSSYTHSDKYPVIHSAPAYDMKWNGKGFSDNARPPRIIFGMKVPTFLIVTAIMTLIVVGAAVGGAVGGTTIRNSNAGNTPSSPNVSSFTGSNMPTATASRYAAPTPTYTALSDCPAANNTVYTSTSGSNFGASTIDFTRYCYSANPLTANNTLASLFTYSFEDCIEACASINFYSSSDKCQLVTYAVGAGRPLNCWIGSYKTTYSALQHDDSTAVALLQT